MVAGGLQIEGVPSPFCLWWRVAGPGAVIPTRTGTGTIGFCTGILPVVSYYQYSQDGPGREPV